MVLMWICVIIVLLLDQKGHTVFANNYMEDDEEVQVYENYNHTDDIMRGSYNNTDGYYIDLNNEEECVNKKCTNLVDKFAPYCETCSPVEVRTSLIPGAGSGLFTKRRITPDEAIADYKSGTQEMTKKQLAQAYPAHLPLPTHVWSPDGKTFYDGSNTNNSIAGLANTGKAWANNEAQPNNARLCKSGMLRAPRKKSIAKGKEVLIAYNW
jgi:hypothetical protein